MTRFRIPTSLPFVLALTFPAALVQAAQYHYVQWESGSAAQGTASGKITLPDDSVVTVQFAAVFANDVPGTFLGIQTNNGANYWSPTEPYISAQVENAPPAPGILQLVGGNEQIYKVTLSEPIKDPIMAIVSLGAPGTTITYNFDSPFTIVSQGRGYWGGNAMSLVQLPNNVLQGTEGHGTIQFLGTFATFSWVAPKPETWHGFTFGIRTTERIEPTPPPDAGEVDAGAFDAGGADVAAVADAATSAPDAPQIAVDASTDVSMGGGAGQPDAAGLPTGDDGCSCALGRSGRQGNGGAILFVMLLGVALVRRRR